MTYHWGLGPRAHRHPHPPQRRLRPLGVLVALRRPRPFLLRRPPAVLTIRFAGAAAATAPLGLVAPLRWDAPHREPKQEPSTGERRRQGRRGRRLTGEKAAEDKLAAGARRRHPPLSARRQLRPVPRRPPLSASIRIGSGGWEVGIETGPEWGGRRPNRAYFRSEPPKTNNDSGPDLVSNRAISFRTDWRPFRAGFGATERGLRRVWFCTFRFRPSKDAGLAFVILLSQNIECIFFIIFLI